MNVSTALAKPITPSGTTRPHDVFWGSHGCKRTYGHANPCICVCNDVYSGTHVYGDDMDSAVSK
jgi:hypothetical protein